MPLFKNGVGRPSNETLKKRKIAYAAIAIGAIALLGTGGYLAYKFTKGDMSTSIKNITTKSLVYGDANGDEKVELSDAIDIQSFLVGSGSIQSTYPKAADVDGDGKISENDATIIQRYISRQFSSLPVKYGDVNKDGKVDSGDVTLIQNYLVQKSSLTKEQKLLADVDLNNKVNMDDVTKIQSYIAKQVSSLPILESDMLSKDIPSSSVGDSDVTIKVSAYKIDSNKKKIGEPLKVVTNTDLVFDKWVNYQYMMVIDAKTNKGTIKSIKWQINSGNKATVADANTEAAWKAGETKLYDYNQASVTKELGIYADGIRLGKITATDSNGNSKTINVKFYVDKTAPKLTFKIAGTKSGSGYVPGAKVTATCTDNLSGLIYMKTYDTQDTSDVVTYNGKATKTKSQSISLVSTGSSRNITTACKDALGNSTGAKKSSSYAIGYYGSSSGSNSNVKNATVKSMTCPAGYTGLSNGKCAKVSGYGYNCSHLSGYTKVGDGPSSYCQKIVKATANCTSPYKYSGGVCSYTMNATPSCPKGTTLKSGKCQTSYGKRTTPSYSCPSLVNGRRGTRSGSSCKYSYSPSYICSSGSRSGSNCIITAKSGKNPIYTYVSPTKITYQCPSGYKLDGTKCYKK